MHFFWLCLYFYVEHFETASCIESALGAEVALPSLHSISLSASMLLLLNGARTDRVHVQSPWLRTVAEDVDLTTNQTRATQSRSNAHLK